MLSEPEILVLKLVSERRLLDDAGVARCVSLYKAARGSRSLSDILMKEGGIQREAAGQIGELAAKARQSKGSVIVSRRDLEDELVTKLLLNKQRVPPDQIKRAKVQQASQSKNGRFQTIAKILEDRNLLSKQEGEEAGRLARERIATCASCYRHYVTPQVLPQKQYPCRNCKGGTIYVGDLPEEAYRQMAGPMPGSPLTSGRIRRQKKEFEETEQERHPALKKKAEMPENALMTGRFQALPTLAPAMPEQDEVSEQDREAADEELTVALTDLRKGKDAKAPKGAKFGPFEVIRELARGGMGVVYKASMGGELVALKVLIGGEEATEQQRKRFKREAEICGKLNHPNIVKVVKTGKIQEFDFIALEFIAGHTVEQMLADGAMDPKIAAQTLVAVASAIDHAHHHDIIHRDLKPENIIISNETNAPKVIDFGVAKALRDEMKFTQSGAAIGTPYYMAPEQVKGEGDRIGPRTDVYALGVILYQMLTGKVPYQASNPMELYHKIASEDIVLPSARKTRIPAELETICLCAMAKSPDDRYASAKALEDDLKAFLAGEAIKGKRPSQMGKSLKRLFANPVLILAAAILVAAILIAVVLIVKG